MAFPFHCFVVLCQSDLQISRFSQKGNCSGRLKLGGGGGEGGGQDSRQVAKGQGPKKKSINSGWNGKKVPLELLFGLRVSSCVNISYGVLCYTTHLKVSISLYFLTRWAAFSLRVQCLLLLT